MVEKKGMHQQLRINVARRSVRDQSSEGNTQSIATIGKGILHRLKEASKTDLSCCFSTAGS